jgi:hypothetical protein
MTISRPCAKATSQGNTLLILRALLEQTLLALTFQARVLYVYERRRQAPVPRNRTAYLCVCRSVRIRCQNHASSSHTPCSVEPSSASSLGTQYAAGDDTLYVFHERPASVGSIITFVGLAAGGLGTHQRLNSPRRLNSRVKHEHLAHAHVQGVASRQYQSHAFHGGIAPQGLVKIGQSVTLLR